MQKFVCVIFMSFMHKITIYLYSMKSKFNVFLYDGGDLYAE